MSPAVSQNSSDESESFVSMTQIGLCLLKAHGNTTKDLNWRECQSSYKRAIVKLNVGI